MIGFMGPMCGCVPGAATSGEVPKTALPPKAEAAEVPQTARETLEVPAASSKIVIPSTASFLDASGRLDDKAGPLDPTGTESGIGTHAANDLADDVAPVVTVELGNKTLNIGLLEGTTKEQAEMVAAVFQELYETDTAFRATIDSLSEDVLSVVLNHSPDDKVIGTATVGTGERMSLNMRDGVVNDPQRIRELIVHEVAHWGGAGEPGAEAAEAAYRAKS